MTPSERKARFEAIAATGCVSFLWICPPHIQYAYRLGLRFIGRASSALWRPPAVSPTPQGESAVEALFCGGGCVETSKRNWHRDRFTYSEGCIERVCPICRRQFWLPPSKVTNNIRCSAECNAKHREAMKEDRKRTCIGCGATFYPRISQLRNGTGKYCSHACHGFVESGENSASHGLKWTPVQREKWYSARERNNSWLFGEKNPRWKGGRDAYLRRYVESGKSRVNCQNRRARIRGNGGELSKDIKQRLFELQRGKCACCGKPLGEKYHLDHIIHISLGGKNVDSNIQLLRARCNIQKSNKHPVDFMRSRGFLL